MIISGVLFETVPGRANTVAMRLARIDGLEITGTDGDSHLCAVWRASAEPRKDSPFPGFGGKKHY